MDKNYSVDQLTIKQSKKFTDKVFADKNQPVRQLQSFLNQSLCPNFSAINLDLKDK